jgi:hypothetical protein
MRATIRLLSLLLATLLAAATFAVSPCAAQVRVEITPFAEAFMPNGDLGDYGGTSEFTTPDGEISESYSATPRGTSVWGAQLTAWFGKQVAVELGAGYSPSASIAQQRTSTWLDGGPFATCDFPQTCTSTAEASTQLTVGSARLLVTLSPPTVGHPSLYVIAGVGVVNYNGAPLQEFGYGGATEWGPDLGVGVRMPLTATMAPRVELEDVFEPASIRNDLIMSAGLSVAVGGGRTPASDASGVTDH